jgi:hypothetical protein
VVAEIALPDITYYRCSSCGKRTTCIQHPSGRFSHWFWGINGATGVLASVLAVMFSMSFGINTTILISAAYYLLLIPTGFALLGLRSQTAEATGLAGARLAEG